MQVFTEEVEEHFEGWNRMQVKDLGTHVGEWVLVNPHPQWYNAETEPRQGRLVSVQFKSYESGKYEDFVNNGKWVPVDLRVTVTGWGGKNVVRDIYPHDTVYVYGGDLEYPEPYTRLRQDAYSNKGFWEREELAAYWHAVAMGDKELAGLYLRFMRGEEL